MKGQRPYLLRDWKWNQISWPAFCRKESLLFFFLNFSYMRCDLSWSISFWAEVGLWKNCAHMHAGVSVLKFTIAKYCCLLLLLLARMYPPLQTDPFPKLQLKPLPPGSGDPKAITLGTALWWKSWNSGLDAVCSSQSISRSSFPVSLISSSVGSFALLLCFRKKRMIFFLMDLQTSLELYKHLSAGTIFFFLHVHMCVYVPPTPFSQACYHWRHLVSMAF